MPLTDDPVWLEDVLSPALGNRLRILPDWKESGVGGTMGRIWGIIWHYPADARASAQSIRNGRPDLQPSTHTRAAIGRWAVSAAHDVTCGFSQDPPAKMPGEGRTNGHPFQRGVWGDGD